MFLITVGGEVICGYYGAPTDGVYHCKLCQNIILGKQSMVVKVGVADGAEHIGNHGHVGNPHIGMATPLPPPHNPHIGMATLLPPTSTILAAH